MWVENAQNIEKAIRDDFDSSNKMQISLILDFFSNKSQEVINNPSNHEVVFWVQNFSEKFRNIWDSWIKNKEEIKKILYQN